MAARRTKFIRSSAVLRRQADLYPFRRTSFVSCVLTSSASAWLGTGDLRHAGISFWLYSGVDPAECARRAGHSIQALFR